MVKKKKVAIVVSRYYLTLPLIIGFYELFDWEIRVIDVNMDTTFVAKDEFYKNIPSGVLRYNFTDEVQTVLHFLVKKYDIVFTTNPKHKAVNSARELGFIKKYYIIAGAFLKPPAAATLVAPQAPVQHVTPELTGIPLWKKIFIPKYYFSFLGRQVAKVKKSFIARWNNPDAFDKVFCWNRQEAGYYEGARQVITAHPYHLYLARKATTKAFSGRILIAHNGDPVYYTPGYNELIGMLIDKYSGQYEITIKAHPLGKNLPAYEGKHSVINKVLDEKELSAYDIFINEDSYMAVEMFFMGKYIINYGEVNKKASNVDFTHMWSSSPAEILERIDKVISEWDTINQKQVNHLEKFYKNYTPPEEFGPLAIYTEG